jgi:hypothetical protein
MDLIFFCAGVVYSGEYVCDVYTLRVSSQTSDGFS